MIWAWILQITMYKVGHYLSAYFWSKQILPYGRQVLKYIHKSVFLFWALLYTYRNCFCINDYLSVKTYTWSVKSSLGSVHDGRRWWAPIIHSFKNNIASRLFWIQRLVRGIKHSRTAHHYLGRTLVKVTIIFLCVTLYASLVGLHGPLFIG